MTQAVATVRDGHAYQARQFWLKALRLLDPAGSIVKVGFESGPKGFDDVWVEYAPGKGRNDHHGVPLLREHMQCKWHVASGDFGYEDLTSPDFINASSVSLLQRALDAQRTHAPAGTGSRFRLVTNWHLRRGDPLRTMVHQRHGFLRPDRLFDGTGDGSAAGKVRKIWRDHLGVDDAQLRTLARTLGLSTDTQSLLDLRDNLDQLLELRGMRRVPDNEETCWYDDLTYQWLAAGRIEFDRDSFRDACQQQKLFEAAPRTHVVFGVKSFEHPVDSLEDRCVAVLDLVHYFNDRPIRNQADWVASLYPDLRSFLLAAAGANEHLRLILDTHATLAFAAGAVLNIKSGRHVELEQRVLHRVIWRAGDTSRDPAWPGWDFTLSQVDTQGSDMAVGVCLTHDVGPAVKRHLAAALPGVGRLLLATPQGGANSRAVASGQHAFDLAESLAQRINAERQVGGRVHLFIAAPNTFTFFLGQRQPSMGSITLYEFDFEGQNGGGYAPSIALPIAKAALGT
jgi:hypothetical protein